MKLKTLSTLCKENNKTAYILKEHDSEGNLKNQYILTGMAIYPANDLPELDEMLLLTIFDVPGKDREKWIIKQNKLPAEIDFKPFVNENEELLKDSLLNFNYRFKAYRVLFAEERTVFINPDYLKPTDDIKEDRELYLRRTESGRDYIVVKYGFIVQAVILAEELISKEFMEELGRLYNRCRTESVLQSMADREHEMQAADAASDDDIPGQQKLGDIDDETDEPLAELAEETCDPETGEIIDISKGRP